MIHYKYLYNNILNKNNSFARAKQAKQKGLEQPQTLRKTTHTRLDKTIFLLDLGLRYPRTHLIPFNSTKEEEELAVLRRLLSNDRANPFKELYNLDYEYGPRLHLNYPEY